MIKPERKTVESDPNSRLDCNCSLVYFPIDRCGEGSAPDRQVQTEAGSDPDDNRIPMKRVIIIDDDPFTLDLVEKMLEGEFEVLKASDGFKGLELINAYRIDLVLLDWMMPDLDGMEVLRILRDNQRVNGTPVVFISGKTDQQSISEALEAGARDYITKPFRKTELLDKIRIIIGGES